MSIGLLETRLSENGVLNKVAIPEHPSGEVLFVRMMQEMHTRSQQYPLTVYLMQLLTH